MVAARVCRHGESLPPGGGDSGGKPRRGHAVVAGDLRESIQPTAARKRPFVSRSLQELAARGWSGARSGLRLHSPESGASRTGGCDAAGNVSAWELLVL